MDTNRTVASELVNQILSLLPGVDCCGRGGCGKSTCLECAKEIASGRNPALCPACSQAAVDEIAALLQIPSVEAADQIAFVRCSGDGAAKERMKSCKTCREAAEGKVGPGECPDGCVGVGTCMDVCRFGAMELRQGRIIIDREKCSGCGACADGDLCPRNLIVMIPRDATNFIPCSSTLEEEDTRAVCGYGCIACGECEEACPEGAISIIDHHAVIDYEKCVGCVACTVKCKKKIIVDTLHDLRELKETVAFVRCSGGRAEQVYRREGYPSCLDTVIKADPQSLGICDSGCSGLGDCTKVCRYDAIHVTDGVAKADPKKCVGCGDCVYACPKGIIDILPYKGTKLVPCSSSAAYAEKEKVCDSACIACGDCVNNCPNTAIHMEQQRAVIDPELCENCQICQYMCPRHVIVEQAVPEYNYLQTDALRSGEGE